MVEQTKEQAVIATLKEHKDRYVSGQELAARAAVSRAAIWKQVEGLRAKGYVIEAAPRRGYRLVFSPDLLIPEELVALIRTETIGHRIVHREEVDSTNDLAKELAQEGAPEGTVVIAEEQKAGRGRLERSWASPRGGIWLSVILRPALAPLEATRFTLLAAVAVAKAIETLGITPEIKWPNDVLIGGRKVCGILLELSAQADRIEHLVIGFGINANITQRDIPVEARERATSLADVLGRDIARAAFVATLFSVLEQEYRRLLDGDWEGILSDWIHRCNMVNKHIVLDTLHGVEEGVFAGVDDFGAIRLRQADGEVQTFAAGDVTVKV
ncbi:MAG: biotin--[acetyl-CoA-carboxylase] ligase [Actinomycetota bacterium]|nr:biotin--[acetyl-CoA-carboxylase] ligase [Actinomycetota bacterium]